MADFDADAFASIATGDDVQEGGGAANHAEAEGADPDAADDVGSESSLRDMLMNSEPSMSLEEVDDPWDPERGGSTRIYRGLMKMLDFAGTPAIVDLAIGLAELVHSARDQLTPEESDAGDGDGEASSRGGEEAPNPPEGVDLA